MVSAPARQPNSWRTAVALAAACAGALAAAPAAGAQGGSSAAYGGVQFYAKPKISTIQCRTLCTPTAGASRTRAMAAGVVSVKEKGVLRIRGRNLRNVKTVLFLGAPGRGDNLGVAPAGVGPRHVDVTVPVAAGSGKVTLLDPNGHSARPSSARVRVLRDPNAPSAVGFVWPLPTRGMITGHWAEDRGSHLHSGVDIAVPAGTPIRAVAPGTVVLLGPQGAYGNFVCIRHARHVTCYAHLSQFLTTYGASVRQGQVIGRVGCTGRCSGDHLHFEVREGPEPWTTPLDPMKFLPRR